MARALRLASTTFDGLEREAVDLHPGHVAAVRHRDRRTIPETDAGDDADAGADDRREDRGWSSCIDACMDGSGLTVVIGSEHQDPDLQHFSVVTSTYTDGTADGRGRRHRPDAHALLARDQRRSTACRAPSTACSTIPETRRPADGTRRHPHDRDHHHGSASWKTNATTPSDAVRHRRRIGASRHRIDQRAAAAARRVLRSAAAQDGGVRQLPQAHRARAPSSSPKRRRPICSTELLPLVDDLERALKADAGARGRRGVSAAASS